MELVGRANGNRRQTRLGGAKRMLEFHQRCRGGWAGPFSNKCGSRTRRIGLQELATVKAKGVLNAEVFGYALAGAVVPGAIAYAAAG